MSSGGGNGGGMIAVQNTLLAAPANAINVPNIPQTARHLSVIIQARTDVVATFDQLEISLNGDNAFANYDSESIEGFSATASAQQQLALAAARRLRDAVPAANAVAGRFSQIELFIANYAGPNPKIVRALICNPYARANNNVLIVTQVIAWSSAAAINALSVNAVGAANLVAGCTLDAYVMP